jgi:pimeloyl-ACP methyl ester carboxylesterase
MATSYTTTTHVTLPSGVKVFYRSAGPSNGPVVLLLHGFPASSFQYRNLIPILADAGYRVVAPDLPGYGFTEIPESLNFKYTFASIADTMEEFLDAVGIKKFAVYIFDYGAPTGFRLAMKRPEAITAIVSQNGNAYEDGLGDFWNPIKELWAAEAGSETEKSSRAKLEGAFLTLAATKWQYTEHEPNPENVDPASWYLDQTLMEREGNKKIQLDLLQDYRENVKLYPQWQEWLRTSQVPLLAIWGAQDEIFINPGATAYKRDLPNARIELVDGGHFLVEAQTQRVAKSMIEFLKEGGVGA